MVDNIKRSLLKMIKSSEFDNKILALIDELIKKYPNSDINSKIDISFNIKEK